MTQQQSGTIRASDIEQLLLWAVRIGVMAVLIVPLVVTTSTYFPYVVGKAIYARVVIEITLALWLILILYYSGYRPSRSWILIAFGVWLLVTLVAGFTGVSFTRSFWSTYERMQGIFDLAHWFAFVLIAGSVFRSLKDWYVPLTANLVVGAVVSALGVGHHFDVFTLDILGSSQRIESTLGNATYVGAYTMVNAMIGLGLILHSFEKPDVEPSVEVRRRASRRRQRRVAEQGGWSLDLTTWLRLFWLVAVAINLWALWLTGTRGAIVGMGAGTVVFGVVYLLWGNMKTVRWASLGVLVATVLAVVLVILMKTTSALDPITESSTTLRRLASIGLDDNSSRGRLVAVQAGLEAFQDRPILGWGPENFLIAWGRYFDVDSGIRERFDQAHSKVLEELTTKGVIGLTAYMLIWLAMAIVLLAAFRRRNGMDQVFVAVIGATAAAYFVQNLFLFDTTTTTLLFALLVAYLISEERLVGDVSTRVGTEGRRFMPEGLGQRLRLHRVGGIVRSSAGVAMAIVVVSVLIGLLLALTFRPFTAATSVVRGAIGQGTWAQKEEVLTRSISEFPGLGNYPRIILISQATEGYRDFSDEELAAAVEVVTAEGQAGLDAEPENWRIRALLAQFYQAASTRDSAYLAVSREHLDEAASLAPRTREVIRITEQQEQLESR